jgi:hypothetical protein
MVIRKYMNVHRGKIQFFAEIISTESKLPLEKITKALEDIFAGICDDEVTVGYLVELEDPTFTLENIKMESVEDYILDLRKYNRECWHTHHKEDKPCKAKIKPVYWHRIRSFCVQNNYH